MNVAAQMLEARTDERGVDHATLALAIDALQDVVAATTMCADACLSDADGRAECVRACADASDVAATLVKVLSRTGPTVQGTQALVAAAAKMLSECAATCAEHAEHEKHCRICAEVCGRGQQALAGLEAEVAAVQVGAGSDG